MKARFRSTFKGFLAKVQNRFRREYVVVIYHENDCERIYFRGNAKKKAIAYAIAHTHNIGDCYEIQLNVGGRYTKTFGVKPGIYEKASIFYNQSL